MNGFADREPVLPPFAMADCFAGVFGACGILAACRAAQKSGHGDVIDLSLLEPLFSMLGPITLEAKLNGAPVPRQGSGSPTHAPRNIYRTREGKYVALSAGMEPMVKRLFEAIGKPELISDPRFAAHAARLANRAALDDEIARFVGTMDRDECLAHFEAADVTVGPVMDAVDLLTDPFMRERGTLADQPDAELGAFPAPSPPIRFQRAGSAGLREAPSLGQHTRELLADLQRSGAHVGSGERR
jgi:crotonobetainyl-CoA:carnitine CoA-transferase CaiB-like acyl-CoA transferase